MPKPLFVAICALIVLAGPVPHASSGQRPVRPETQTVTKRGVRGHAQALIACAPEQQRQQPAEAAQAWSHETAPLRTFPPIRIEHDSPAYTLRPIPFRPRAPPLS